MRVRPSLNGSVRWAILCGCLLRPIYAANVSMGPASPIRPASFLPAPQLETRGPFGFLDVESHARDLAKSPYQEPDKIPDFLLHISYDQWRDIRFRPQKALWRNEDYPFQVQFFHPGLFYNHPVRINVVDPAGVKPVSFSTDLFDYGKNRWSSKVPSDLGFAGFRIHYPLNKKDYRDEVIVFLGASYFRAVAEKQQYGLSARGIAVDTALASGEEFPSFKEFWIVKPARFSKTMTIYALLDGPSVAGAYQFVIRPGKETLVKVAASLWFRNEVDKPGLAPLNSMFFFGENSSSQNKYNDFRPEVHDSDGLLVVSRKGDWLWRPLIDPERLYVNSFETDGLRGFGLLQRDMNFDHYQDLESRYDLRPSVWITPVENPETSDIWKSGHVELVQIPTPTEANDNAVAYWVPAKKLVPGKKIALAYTMRWFSPGRRFTTLGYVSATHVIRTEGAKAAKFVLDFDGERLKKFTAKAPLNADVILSGGAYHVSEMQLYKNSVTQGWRLVFRIEADKNSGMDKIVPARESTIELRAALRTKREIMTETWSYAIPG